MITKNIEIPEKILNTLFIEGENKRYICLYGGRGSGKSWGIADYLLISSLKNKKRILCTREYQNSIKDSVHRLLCDRIEKLGFSNYFEITRESIRAYNGSEFIFKGLALHIEEIKSTEGVDICWVEEAEKVTEEHWDTLTPTIRKENSKILISFNPEDEENATYKRFVLNPSEDTINCKINFYDNPFLPEVLIKEIEYDKKYNYEKYLWKWEGNPRKVSDAVVFKGKVEVQDFEISKNPRYFHGVDWGFSNDPTALVRCYIEDNYLFVDKEIYGYGVDIDELPQLFNSIETTKRYPIKADAARPETISYMKRKGFNIAPAKKWQGSIEDGIEYLRSFKKIIVKPECKNLIEEFKLYSFKKDANNGEVLPIIIDKYNHGIDALRYALDGYIKGRNIAYSDFV